jgi:hypothetical protein
MQDESDRPLDRARVAAHQERSEGWATLDWIEQTVDTGKVDMDGELARMLRGE